MPTTSKEARVRVRLKTTRFAGDGRELRDAHSIVTIPAGMTGILTSVEASMIGNAVVVTGYVVWDAAFVTDGGTNDEDPVVKIATYAQDCRVVSGHDDTDVPFSVLDVIGVDEPKDEPVYYGAVRWTVSDVQTLREDLTDAQAETFLQNNAKHLRDRLIESGWDVMTTLLDMDESLPAKPKGDA